MGLVFLRHAYSRYLTVKDKIEADLPSRGGKTRALTKEDFSQQSAIFLQPKAQFDYLVALPDSDDRAKAIIEAMESIEAGLRQPARRPAQERIPGAGQRGPRPAAAHPQPRRAEAGLR